MKTILILLLPVQLLAQASFNYSVTGLTVDFAVTNPTGFVYQWNYGDGMTDTTFSDSSEHTYASAGSFLVKLRVFDTTFLLLDSTDNLVSIQATGIEEFYLRSEQLKGRVFDISGKDVGEYRNNLSPGIYILVTPKESRKIVIY